LPEAYTFLGTGIEQRAQGRTSVRSTDYRLDTASGSVVEVCVAEPGLPRTACAPAGAEDRTIERRVGAYPVWIRPLGADSLADDERTYWSTVPLSADLAPVSWLT